MRATSKRRALLARLQRSLRKAVRSASSHPLAPLDPELLEAHAKLLAEPKPMSGRSNAFVYYWAYKHLCWRRLVIPKDPRTPPQRASRTAFRTASKAWSQNQPLTEAQRRAWRTEAAKLQSHPRLWQAGTLTPQQHFVGRNAVKDQWGQPLLLDPHDGTRMKDECRMMKAETAAQHSPAQGLAQPSASIPQAHAAPSPSASLLATAALTHHASRITHHAPSLPQAPKPHAKKPLGTLLPTQHKYPEPLRKASSGHFRCKSVPRPVRYRCPRRLPMHARSFGSPRTSTQRAYNQRTTCLRELWRGG